MNKNRYRVIFSKSKNMFIAVAENIKSQTKAAGQNTKSNQINASSEVSDSKSFHQLWQVKSIVASMSLFMAFSPVYAQMQADPAAAAHQQASIGVGQNQQGQNVPVINIQTPKNGVSHNVYNQFDVLQPGAVLNNSRNGAGSVIVGQVGANPYLQTGEARIILNEVNSATASRFEGNLEVAGQRADVIIANPSGINIQGGGFINANKAIFTTGKAQLNEDGSINQFVVDQGKISVNSTENNLGLGGNNNNADYVDIYAKAVELNAQVHANQNLQVITGSNNISDDLSEIKSNNSENTSPNFALDVKALGGMYANNIFIIGTDKGLGVSNAGTMQSPQNLVITSSGKVENSGTISNTNPQNSLLSINTLEAADIVNKGSLITNGNLFISSDQNLIVDKGKIEKHGADNQNIISLSAKVDVNLSNSANVQNFGEGGDIYIDASNINVGNDVNIGGNGSIKLSSINNIDIVNSRNISSIGSIDIQANNNLNIVNTNIWANNGNVNFVNSGGDFSFINISTDKIYSGNDLNIIGTNDVRIESLLEQPIAKGINIYSGKNLELGSSTKDTKLIAKDNINITSSGYLTGEKLKVESEEGTVNIQSTNDFKVNSVKEISKDDRAPDLDITTYKGSFISGLKGINIISSDLGGVRLENTYLNSSDGNIQIYAGNGFSYTTFIDTILTNFSLFGETNYFLFPAPALHKSTSKSFLLNSNKDIDINFFSIETNTGGVILNGGEVSNINLSNLDLNSNGNIEIFAKDINANFLNLNSQQHVALSAKNSTSLDYSNINSKGIFSSTNTNDFSGTNTTIKSGAILLEQKQLINSDTLNLETMNSELLRNNEKLNTINGDIVIQNINDLNFGSKINPYGDIELISNDGDIILESNENNVGMKNGTENKLTLESLNGNIKLEGKSVNLKAVDLYSKGDIDIVSSNGDIKIDGLKKVFNSQKNVLESAEYVDDFKKLQLLSTAPFDINNPNQFNQAYDEFIDKYPVQANNSLFIFGSTTPIFHNIMDGSPFPASYVFEYKEDSRLPVDLKDRSGNFHIASNLESDSGNISIIAKNGVSISGANIKASNGIIDIQTQNPLDQNYTTTTVESNAQTKTLGASIIIDGLLDFYEKGFETDSNYNMQTGIIPTILNGSKGVKIATVGNSINDNLILQAVGIISQQGDVKVESNKNIIFDAAIEQNYDRTTTVQKKKSWGGLKKKYITTVKESGVANAASVEIQAKNINIESKEASNPNNYIDIYSGKLNAEENISIRSGGNINFYTVQESSTDNVDITKKSSFAGMKYNDSKSSSTRSIVSELPASLKAEYIGVKSDFDTRLVGTEFEYLKGATIESGGTTFIQPAITNITETLKKEKSSVVWQSMQDKGSIIETGKLPSFNGPTPPIFKAAGGLEVQIPIGEQDQNKVQIKDEIIKLANQPGNEYLNELVKRDDVDWNKVILTQQNWDYKSQGLTGAGAALVVIIVTVLTSGAGTAAAGAIGGGASTQAAVATLASQASVSLINNGGDIGKTLKDLGSKESVKGLVTSVITAGLLSEVGAALNIKPDSSVFSDRLIKNFTNSVGSTLVQTAINGGNLEDNLKVAILSGLAGALQGELASQIGINLDKVDPSVLEYTIHKIAHAAAGCATAAIVDKSNCEAGAIGAGVGEIVAGLMIPEGKTALDLTDDERTNIKNTSKIIVGITAAYAGYDVNTAANSADIAVENNSLPKLITSGGKAAYKIAKEIKELQAKGTAIKPADVVEMFKKEGIQGIIDIGNNITTLISPTASLSDKAFAALDLVIGIDLKAGKNVDVLKADRNIIGSKVSREINLPRVSSFEQARNIALEETNLNGSNSIPVTCRLPCSAGNGLIVGRKSKDGKLIWRLDYDPEKGPHINIEDYRLGKGDKAIKKYVQFDGNEETFKSYLKQINQ